uniref:BZIP domain-containing protein n=2 Tax=Phytophthora ramorum TaxID=164328 RepID=H3GX81_PHYRM
MEPPQYNSDFLASSIAATSKMVGPLFTRGHVKRGFTSTDWRHTARVAETEPTVRLSSPTAPPVVTRRVPMPMRLRAKRPFAADPHRYKADPTSKRQRSHGEGVHDCGGGAYLVPNDGNVQRRNPKRAGPGGKQTATQLAHAQRREQCRVNQARYRSRQNDALKELEEVVSRLKQEEPLLALQRDRALYSTKHSVFTVVVEYFHLFRNGLRAPASSVQGEPRDAFQEQVVFLRSSLTPDVMLGERQGVEALIEQWRRYSTYFGDLCFQLDHITEVSKNLVQVSASLRVTVTNATFDNVFPHLLAEERGYRRDGEEDLKAATLGSKLLERRLLLPCKLYFEWDESSCQLVRLNMDVDFLAPISRVLDSLEDAAYVLGQARISVDGAIGKRV